ncbi:hypothetical protein [Treponema pedis]|uniref:hypothetical protein n=1 Tax=Treponema pedis TaxID=409322 RepID=UPI00041FAD87|nr:hypothetical protein [Treponema pedis]
MNTEFFDALNRIRAEKGFLSLNELIKLQENGNIIFDPFSTLISSDIEIGAENIFYPASVFIAVNGGKIKIGNANTFAGGGLFVADKGNLSIGSNNYFGDGPIVIKANFPDSNITIKNYCRVVIGAQVFGKTYIGTGCQIIGRITVQDCFLEDGNSYASADPDLRGAVLKGFGTAKGLKLNTGYVINGQGNFTAENIKKQSYFHNK